MNIKKLYMYWLQVMIAKWLYYVGWVTTLGMIFLILTAWQYKKLVDLENQPLPRFDKLIHKPIPSANLDYKLQLKNYPQPTLPRSGDIDYIISSLERHITQQGIPWVQAEYKWQPLSENQLANLQISTTLKGTYKQIKTALYNLLKNQPAFALRELNFNRSNSDLLEIDAKIVLVIYLADDWSGAIPKAWTIDELGENMPTQAKKSQLSNEHSTKP